MNFELIMRVIFVGVGVLMLVLGIMQSRRFRKAALDDTRPEPNEEEEQALADKLAAVGPGAEKALYDAAFKIDRDEGMAKAVVGSVLAGRISATRDLIQDRLFEKYPDKKQNKIKIQAYKGFVSVVRTVYRLMLKESGPEDKPAE